MASSAGLEGSAYQSSGIPNDGNRLVWKQHVTMIRINTDRPKLELERDGVVTVWEYDVVLIKIEIERLNVKHELTDGTPSLDYLLDFSEYLERIGLVGCNCAVALQMWSLVPVQFNQLSVEITTQLASLVASS